MSQRDVWSLGFGHFRGIHLRLHLFFVLFCTFTLYLAWQLARQVDKDATPFVLAASICLVILFVSLLVHELAHIGVACRLGGHADTIVLGPLGGLNPVRIANDPQSELLATLAGPLASLGLCVAFLITSVLFGDGGALQLLHPLSPGVLIGTSDAAHIANTQTLIRLACWINWMLVLVNLIPAFPFDGGRVCLAFVRALRPDMTLRRATQRVSALAKLFALGLLIAAWYFRSVEPIGVAPHWLALVLLAIFVFFSAKLEEDHEDTEEGDTDLFGYDFSQGFTSLERSSRERIDKRGPITRWWRRMKVRRQMRLRALEADDDRRLDEVLERLHQLGFDKLSLAEKSLLRRVSARYRSREDSR